MKKNKMTKLALALGTVATIAAPIAAVVSCGSGTEHSNEVIIKYTWAANGPQVKALQPVVDYYNKNVAKDGDFKVKLVHVEGGYGKAVELDTRDMGMNNMGPVADVIIDYPDSLGQLSSKALDFKATEGGTNIESLFENGFVTTDVERQANKGVFSLPLAKSTEMLSIDIPYMAALAQAKVATLDGKVKAAADAYAADNSNAAEIDGIVKSFKLGTTTPTTPVATIDDATINNYDKLFAQADLIAQAIPAISAKSAMHVVGEDAPTNLLYQLFNSRVNYNKDKFLFHKDGANFNYDALENKDSEGGKVVDALLQGLQKHIKVGGLVMNGGGAYSSTDLVDHNLPFVIGSTAGFTHNYKVQAAFGVQGATGTPVSLTGYNAEIAAPTGELKTKGAIAMTTDKYHNPVFPSTYSGDLGEHDYKVATPATDALINTAITNGDAMVLKESKAAPATAKVNKGTYNYQFVSGKKVSMAAGKDKTHVNPEEVLSLNAPLRSDSDETGTEGTENQILSQGPSFIGIKHGGQKDVDTVKFMNWFFGADSKFSDASGNTTTPIDAFDNASGYITPIKGAFADANKAKYKEGNLVAFEAFAKVTPGGIAFDNPVSRFSSSIRKSAEAAIKTIYSDAHAGTVTPATELYGDFSDSFTLK